jgi:CheY-like chemotaxis protein
VTTMLVIDDDDEMRSSLRTIFEGAGYEVHEARHGLAGVACCQVHAIDLVLTDILMPEQDGLETMRALRTRHHPAKFIAMSAVGSRTLCLLLEMSLLLSADRTLPKLIQPSTLLMMVQTLLTGTSARTWPGGNALAFAGQACDTYVPTRVCLPSLHEERGVLWRAVSLPNVPGMAA